MRKIILSCLLFCFPVFGASTLRVCSKLEDSAVYFSMLRQVGAGAGWQARGWYKVTAKGCFDFNMGSYVGKLYLYAEDEKKESSWGTGNVEFCVHKSDGFSYNNADTIACSDANQKRVRSDEVTIVDGVNTWTLSPNLTKLDLCNENSFAIYASVGKQLGTAIDAIGWFRLEPNACRPHTVGQYTGPVYTYAELNGGQLSWGTGQTQFCVHQTNAFRFLNADSAADCDPLTSKMVDVTTTQVSVGVTKITFEPKTLKTTLRLCNNTTDRNLSASYGIVTGNDPTLKIRSQGWLALTPQQCAEVDLSGYVGPTYVYAETAGGEEFWGSGPTETCVNRKTSFTIDDSTNAAACNLSFQQKMVPTSQFNVVAGTNTFSFN